MTDMPDFADPYETFLYQNYTTEEVTEIQQRMVAWDKATYPTLSTSIVRHCQKHGFEDDYLRYLRKADNFNKKGARKKYLPDGAIRWNKEDEFLIERDGKIVTYGEND
jgi:glutathione peroxidase-family protein